MKKRDRSILIAVLFAIPVIFITVSVFFKTDETAITSGEISFSQVVFWLFFVIGMVSFIVAIIVYGIIVSGSNKGERIVSTDLVEERVNQLNKMSMDEFKKFIGSSLEFCGYEKQFLENCDFGEKFVTSGREGKLAVLIEKKDMPINVKDVQAFAEFKKNNDCIDAWYIASAPGFSQAAIHLSSVEKIKLYCEKDLVFFLMDLKESVA